ncbi:hypothetical protein [Patulibacter defluvii]|uniref:hypothetical protein n=1 Tax=Patulibacter defluvii TaxID=3095358 RepID=UPI002A74BCFB|nr:hypothetical protein [Patulibacter sp. DM4]
MPQSYPIPLDTITSTPASGTLTGGVEWAVDKGGPNASFTCTTGDQTWTFDRTVDLRFGITGLNAPGESVQLPEGVEAETIDPLHQWDPATRTVSRVTNASQNRVSTFRLNGVDSLVLTPVGGCNWVRNAAFIEVVADIPATPPTVDISGPADGAEYFAGQDVPAAYSCEGQDGATIASCEGDVPNGQPIDTTTPGAHSFKVTATDSDGSVTEKTVNYTVRKSKAGMRIYPSILAVLPAKPGKGLLPLVPLARVSLTFAARLTDEGGKPVVGENVTFTGAGGSCTAKTDADGVANCGDFVNGLVSLLSLGYTARFHGSATQEPAAGQGYLIEATDLGLRLL